MCTKTTQVMCVEQCDNCYSRSLAKLLETRSDILFLPENTVDPLRITSTNKNKYRFRCLRWTEGTHIFELAPCSIKAGAGCPFACCLGLKVCGHDDCNVCYNNSLLSILHKKGIEIENMEMASTITKNSRQKLTFLCNNPIHLGMIHKWDTTPQGLRTCPYIGCVLQNGRVCGDEECTVCFKESLISALNKHNLTVSTKDLQVAKLLSKKSDKKITFVCKSEIHEGFIHQWTTTAKGLRSCSFPGCSSSPVNLCDNLECPSCRDSRLSTALISRKYLKCAVDNAHRIFRTSNQLLKWICPKDTNHTWSAKASDVVSRNSGCPFCLNKTEADIYNLVNNYYRCTRQFTIPGCINIHKLPFDIFVPDLKLIIEVDGGGHFKDVSFWKSEFAKVQSRDCYKMRCAINAGYSVLRICCQSFKLGKINFEVDVLPFLKIYSNPTLNYVAFDPHIYDSHQRMMMSVDT